MTALVRKRQVRLWRLFVGSLVGTTYLLVLFVEALAPLDTMAGKLVLSILIIITTFGFSRFILLFKDTLTFYAVSFLFGGGIFALSFLIQKRESTLNGLLVVEDAFVYPQASLLTLAIGYILMIFLSKFYFQAIEVGKRREQFLLPYRLTIMGETITGIGLLDSGNSLHEPITRVPVMILQVELLASVLPQEIASVVKKGTDVAADVDWLDQVSTEWQSRLRWIPYRGVGKGNQFLIALTPDELTIVDGEREVKTTRVRVGLTKESLSAENAYAAILHPGLLSDAKPVKQIEEVHYANKASP